MDNKINLGECPHCNCIVPLQKTDTDSIFRCPVCLKQCKQYINGKVLYNTIDFQVDESEEYP